MASPMPVRCPTVMVSRIMHCAGCGHGLTLRSYGPAGPPIGLIWCWPCTTKSRTPAEVVPVSLTKSKRQQRVRAARLRDRQLLAGSPPVPVQPKPAPDRQTCWTHKVRYLDAHEAAQALAAYRAKKRKRQNRMRAYECCHCQGWHLTHILNYRPKKVGIW